MSLEGFADHVRGLQLGSEAFNAFLSSTENKEALQRYAQSIGCSLTPEEQDQILSMRSTIHAAAQETKGGALSDTALDGVTGGFATDIGNLVGGGLAEIGGIAAFRRR